MDAAAQAAGGVVNWLPAELQEIIDGLPSGFVIKFCVVGENGTLDATVDGVAISSGALVDLINTVHFVATPAEGYEVKQWLIDDTPQISTENETDFSTTVDQSIVEIKVEFEEKIREK